MTTKFFSATAFSIITTISAFAQDNKKSNVHIGFLYPISSNGIQAKEYSNTFSVHAIGGVSKSEEAFCASGVSNIVMNDVKGFIAAGVVNFIHDSVDGVSAAGFLNYANHHVNGLQAGGFMNLAGSVKGAQLAGFGNISEKDVKGAQLGGFINVADDADMQGAGFINIGKNIRGTQIAGFTNIAESTNGLQLAGFANVADSVNTQISGFINIARKVKGVQLAGFINIADSSDYPIGLINIVKNGEKGIGITVDESLTTLAAFRSGGRVIYGILGAGYNVKTGDVLYAMEAGLGAHFAETKHFRLNLEGVCTSLTDFQYKSHFKSSLRVLPAYKAGKHIEVFAGPTLNFVSYNDGVNDGLVDNYLWNDVRWGYFYGMNIGVIGGVQFRF